MYKCEYCVKEFNLKRYLQQHEKTSEHKYMCVKPWYISKLFTKWYCKLCDQDIPTKSKIFRHVKTGKHLFNRNKLDDFFIEKHRTKRRNYYCKRCHTGLNLKQLMNHNHKRIYNI